MSGQIDPQAFIDATDAEWGLLLAFSSKLFYASGEYQELDMQYSRALEVHEQELTELMTKRRSLVLQLD